MPQPNKKILIVANNCQHWTTWPEKMAALRGWFASKVDLAIDLRHTKFDALPYAKYESPDGTEGWQGIAKDWYDEHIALMAIGYDIVLFVVPLKQWAFENKARGWRADQTFGPVELQIACDEHERNFWPNGQVINSFLDYSRHEILHALFMMTGQNDSTHMWWDAGKLENALAEIVFPVPHTTDNIVLYKRIIAWLQRKVASLRKEIAEIEQQNTPPLLPPQPPPPEPPLPKITVQQFCKAIEWYEGYYPPGANPEYPNGTLAWRNRNPGNLRYAKQARAIGKDKNGFAVFKTYQDGFGTLVEMVNRAIKGKSTVYSPQMTFQQYFAKYAPPEDNNDPDLYARSVAKRLGVPVTTRINQLSII